jgi:hypothetical protein
MKRFVTRALVVLAAILGIVFDDQQCQRSEQRTRNDCIHTPGDSEGPEIQFGTCLPATVCEDRAAGTLMVLATA